MRIVALLQTHNERRFIAACLDHLEAQGILVYLVDNESTDETVEIARERTSRNVIGIETLPRAGSFALKEQLRRKEELAAELEADWFIHQDTDELRVSHEQGRTLAQTIEKLDGEGYNAANFTEFVFMPTLESPDHDNAEFASTMRSYYPYIPRSPHRLNAWRRQEGPIELIGGGHLVRFADLRMAPESMSSRHYLFLSLEHAIEKFGPSRRYAPAEVKAGWHRWRSALDPGGIRLHSQAELRTYTADHLLDPSDPYTEMSQLVRTEPPAASRPGWLRRTLARAPQRS